MRLVIEDERGVRLEVVSDGEARYRVSGTCLRDNLTEYETVDDLHVMGLVQLHLSAWNSQEYLRRRLSERDQTPE